MRTSALNAVSASVRPATSQARRMSAYSDVNASPDRIRLSLLISASDPAARFPRHPCPSTHLYLRTACSGILPASPPLAFTSTRRLARSLQPCLAMASAALDDDPQFSRPA